MSVASSTVRVTAANLVLGVLLIFWLVQDQPRPDWKDTHLQALLDRVPCTLPVQHDRSPSGLHVNCSLLPPMFTYFLLFRATCSCIAPYGAVLFYATYCQDCWWVFCFSFCFICVVQTTSSSSISLVPNLRSGALQGSSKMFFFLWGGRCSSKNETLNLVLEQNGLQYSNVPTPLN